MSSLHGKSVSPFSLAQDSSNRRNRNGSGRAGLLRRFVWATLVLFSCGCWLPAVSANDQLANSSLKLVPADAAFFASWSYQAEQWQMIRQSAAFARLMDLPSIKSSLAPLLDSSLSTDDEEILEARAWLAQPIVQVVLDALSHEVFIYGDVSLVELLDDLKRCVAVYAQTRLKALAQGKSTEEADKAATKIVKAIYAELKLPDIVIGFKVKDVAALQSQLDQFDALAGLYLNSGEIPPVYRQRYQRQTIGGCDYRTLQLDGSLLPVNQLSFSEDTDPEDAAFFRQFLRSLTLTVSVGLRDDYLIVSIGDSAKHLERLGQVPSLLDHNDFQLVRSHADKSLTSIRYVASSLLAQAQPKSTTQYSRLNEYFRDVTQGDAQLSDTTRSKIEDALAALDKELGQQPSEPPAARLGFTYLTPRGFEGFSYRSADAATLAGEPLEVLQQVGDDPLLVLAGTTGLNAESYREWLKRLGTLRESFNFSDADFDVMLAQYQMHFAPINEVIQEELIPALERGQLALVLSANESSRQWHPELPEADQELPMPELAVVMQLRDRRQFVRAIQKCRDAILPLISPYIQMAEEDDDFVWPKPIRKETDSTTIIAYPYFPELTSISPETFAPSAGISDGWLVLSHRPAAVSSLLRRGSFGHALKDSVPEQPLGFTYVNVSGVVDVVQAWFDYLAQLDPPGSEDEQAERELYSAMMDLARCVRSYQRVTYREESRRVTHTVWQIRDLSDD